MTMKIGHTIMRYYKPTPNKFIWLDDEFSRQWRCYIPKHRVPRKNDEIPSFIEIIVYENEPGKNIDLELSDFDIDEIANLNEDIDTDYRYDLASGVNQLLGANVLPPELFDHYKSPPASVRILIKFKDEDWSPEITV